MAEFTRTRGDDWEFTIPLTQPGTTDPFDLTGATVRVTFKTNKKLADNAAGVFQYSWSALASDGIVVSNPVAGIGALTVPAADTSQFAVAKYFYDVQITDANGKTHTVEPIADSPDPLRRVATVKVTEDVTQLVP